jgi:peptidoglycan hydrolase-like protein with peptidoglycan-binding domain
MRYREFKIVEVGGAAQAAQASADAGTLDPEQNVFLDPSQTRQSPSGDSADDVAADDAARSSQGLEAGPPYPPEQEDQVKALQRRLEELGYSVGSTGIDGKYGPRTSRAVAAFMRDNNLQTSDSGRSIDAAGLAKLQTATRVANPTPTGNARIDPRVADGDPDFESPEYPPGMTRASMESIIADEARLRGIDPSIAIRIFRAEGAGGYQSSVRRSGRGSLGGREASFGPYQLYIGGGLGNEYQERTGRDLTTDNTEDGIRNQIRFALDAAVTNSWQPWYGRGPAGVGRYDGLETARRANNWS